MRLTRNGQYIADGVTTHEQYIQAVKAIVTVHASDDDAAKLSGLKLAYGAGMTGLRGVTYYDRWGNVDTKAPFVEVCAFGQESIVQLTGTVIHELGHVLAGWNAGHGPEWKAACERLGLRKVMAAGTRYCWMMFKPEIREALYSLPRPTDGQPVCSLPGQAGGLSIGKRKRGPKPCTAGHGVKGGQSYSASRLRKYVCEGIGQKGQHKPQVLRAATDTLDCTCNVCGSLFTQAG